MDDIKQSLAALAYDEKTMDELLNTKFDDGKLKNLSFGDIYFLAMDKMYNNFRNLLSVFNNCSII